MQLKTIRKIDKYLGPIAVKILLIILFLSRLFSSRCQENPSKNINKILILKFFGLGSIIFSIPALKHTKEQFPSAQIVVVTLEENREICQSIADIDKCFTLKLDNILFFLRDFLVLIMKLRKENFDAVVDLEFFTNFSAVTTLFLSIGKSTVKTVGFYSAVKWRNVVYSEKVTFDHSRHISETFVKAFSSFSGKQSSSRVTDKIAIHSNSLKPNSFKEIPGLNVISGDIVSININAGDLCLLRRWPQEYFIHLIDELSANYEVTIVLIGSQKETTYVGQLTEQLLNSSKVIDLCGKTTLSELMWLLKKSRLVITNDSGPLHLACLVGVPTISFFGPETPVLYGPIGENHHVFYDDYFCSPCLTIYNSKLSVCKNNVCLKNIPPISVLDVIRNKNLITSSESKAK